MPSCPPCAVLDYRCISRNRRKLNDSTKKGLSRRGGGMRQSRLQSAEQPDAPHTLARLLGVTVRVSGAACSRATERQERTDDRLPLFLYFLPLYLFTCAAFEWTCLV